MVGGESGAGNGSTRWQCKMVVQDSNSRLQRKTTVGDDNTRQLGETSLTDMAMKEIAILNGGWR